MGIPSLGNQSKEIKLSWHKTRGFFFSVGEGMGTFCGFIRIYEALT